VYVSAADRPPLPEGHFYHHELLGLEVVDEDGALLGQLSEILQTGANDVYVVKAAQRGELLLPAIESVVVRIDVAGHRIQVRVPDGLIPESPRSRVKGSPAGKKWNAGRE
jgi:16S rRNA processing protein RimM